MNDFAAHLNKVVLPKVQKELGIKNLMATPQLSKIVINVGIGSRLKNTKDYSDVVDNVSAITGQKPTVTYSKQAISNFKLREGMPNGIRTTLRRKKMIDFFNRLVNVALPRIRDFQGISPKAFDGNGNYSIGIKDCTIFPEVNPDDLSHVHGMSITIVTTADTDEEAKALLKALNFPFKKAPVIAEKEELVETPDEDSANTADETAEESAPVEAEEKPETATENTPEA